MADAAATCTHKDQIKKDVKPASDTCLECVKEGLTPVQLRMCLTCGHIGCCDSSVGRHATKHFKETNHAIMKSFKSAPAGGEEWTYCYIDQAYL
jgi:uncharacterized UBP type Zn finger protein